MLLLILDDKSLIKLELDRCIGRWLAERSATCPLCKTELFDEEEDSSSEDEAEASPPRGGATQSDTGGETITNWRQFISMLNFNLEGGHENLVTAAADANRAPTQGEEGQGEDLSSEPSFWRRWLLQRRGRRRRTLAEEHGVTLNALSEPLLQAENGEVENVNVEAEPSEPRPDPPEGGSPAVES